VTTALSPVLFKGWVKRTGAMGSRDRTDPENTPFAQYNFWVLTGWLAGSSSRQDIEKNMALESAEWVFPVLEITLPS